MRVVMRDKTLQYDNTEQGMIALFHQIESIQAEDKLIFDHLTVDGVEVYHEVEEYLRDHLVDITQITVHLLSTEELKLQVLHSVYEYVNRAVPEIQLLTDQMYKGLSTEVWGKFGQLLEGLQWLSQTATFIQDHNGSHEFEPSLLSFQKELEGFEEALDQEDNVLLGDIMQYEIIPRFEEIEGSLCEIINKEVVAHDFN